MAKTKPIGVRFDETLLTDLKNAGLADSPQKALNLYEKSYLELINLKIEINNQPENKKRIMKEREGHYPDEANKREIRLQVDGVTPILAEEEIRATIEEKGVFGAMDAVVADEIEKLTKAANSCADTTLGRKTKDSYLRKIQELKKINGII